MYPLEEINRIRQFLVEKCYTLAVAESVTSGHLQAAFSLADDARAFFQGGITTYNLGQKCRQLDVDPIDAIKYDCVSDSVARQMATGVSGSFLSHYGIGITGYAAVVPEKNIHSLFAHFAISYRGQILISDRISAPDGKALEAQVSYTRQVITAFDELLKKSASGGSIFH
jgi:PncC family amidohydrolase